MLLQGGDTDTNAAIVGGLIGAAQGLKTIEPSQIKAILDFDPQIHGGHPRPEFLIPHGKLIPMVTQVFTNSP